MSEHLCHATGCRIAVPPKIFMCLKHWRMVPRAVQRVLLAEFVPGQEVTKTPTNEYLNVAIRAVALVAAKEGLFTPKAGEDELLRLW